MEQSVALWDDANDSIGAERAIRSALEIEGGDSNVDVLVTYGILQQEAFEDLVRAESAHPSFRIFSCLRAKLRRSLTRSISLSRLLRFSFICNLAPPSPCQPSSNRIRVDSGI